jgi:hypothetical protein
MCDDMMRSKLGSIWDVFDGGGKYSKIMSAAKRVAATLSDSSGDVQDFVFMDFVSKVNDLNVPELVDFCKNSNLCGEAFDFLNLRTSIVIKGPDFYGRVAGGDYSRLKECGSLMQMLRQIYYEVVGGFFVLYFERTNKGIETLKAYSDDVFVRLFDVSGFGGWVGEGSFNKLPPHVKEAMEPYGGLTEVVLPDLGVVHVGEFLRHTHLGIFWVYRLFSYPNGEIRADAMFKDSKRLLFLGGGAGLLTRP